MAAPAGLATRVWPALAQQRSATSGLQCACSRTASSESFRSVAATAGLDGTGASSAGTVSSSRALNPDSWVGLYEALSSFARGVWRRPGAARGISGAAGSGAGGGGGPGITSAALEAGLGARHSLARAVAGASVGVRRGFHSSAADCAGSHGGVGAGGSSAGGGAGGGAGGSAGSKAGWQAGPRPAPPGSHYEVGLASTGHQL